MNTEANDRQAIPAGADRRSSSVRVQGHKKGNIVITIAD
jgi:hypothetical protein